MGPGKGKAQLLDLFQQNNQQLELHFRIIFFHPLFFNVFWFFIFHSFSFPLFDFSFLPTEDAQNHDVRNKSPWPFLCSSCNNLQIPSAGACGAGMDWGRQGGTDTNPVWCRAVLILGKNFSRRIRTTIIMVQKLWDENESLNSLSVYLHLSIFGSSDGHMDITNPSQMMRGFMKDEAIQTSSQKSQNAI